MSVDPNRIFFTASRRRRPLHTRERIAVRVAARTATEHPRRCSHLVHSIVRALDENGRRSCRCFWTTSRELSIFFVVSILFRDKEFVKRELGVERDEAPHSCAALLPRSKCHRRLRLYFFIADKTEIGLF